MKQVLYIKLGWPVRKFVLQLLDLHIGESFLNSKPSYCKAISSIINIKKIEMRKRYTSANVKPFCHLDTLWQCLQQCHEGRKRHLRRPHFSKQLTKLAIFPDYKRPGMLCLALPAPCKVRKLDFQNEFLMSKIIRISLIFFFH